MASREEVEQFLNEFRAKMSVWEIVFEDREKNLQALADLEITAIQRLEYIKKLKVENYFAGPKKDTNDISRPDYWEFGTKVKKHEVYVKINMGLPGKSVLCISFHITEREIHYCFKKMKRDEQ